MPINTVFDPSNVNFFDKTKLNKDAQGLQMTVTAGTTGTIDLTLTMDIVVAGGSVLLAKGAAPGDYVEFQIVHPIYGVINQFITKWYCYLFLGFRSR